MSLSTFDCIAAITEHSAGFAEAARAGDPGARIEHCPEWSLADLVQHLTEVHWFWATIVDERLDAPPDKSRRPVQAADADPVEEFVAGAARLVHVLREADQSARCWTWAPWRSDVSFVTRHQVQEAAVHHWDAAHAAGQQVVVAADVAVDSIDEFLHFSVASEDDSDDPPAGALDGPLSFRATDTGDTWTLSDSERPGALHVERGDAGSGARAVVEAPASDLLLWLYGRVDIDRHDASDELVQRFRSLCFTD